MRVPQVDGRVRELRARARLRLHELFDTGPAAAAPEPRAPVRLALDRRALAALLVIALGGVLLAGTVVLRSRPHVAAVAPATVIATGSPIPVPGATPSAAAQIVVDVQGMVRHPGVVRLPPGSRVQDALRAAGGPRPGVPTTALNLAKPLTDGEQVVLLSAASAASGAAPAAGPAPGGTGGLPVDLNSATLADLDRLPGVGPVLAQRILDWRAEHGRFSSVEELQEVPGIGPSTFADLKDRVRV